jgi:hypothetical protein
MLGVQKLVIRFLNQLLRREVINRPLLATSRKTCIKLGSADMLRNAQKEAVFGGIKKNRA